MWNQIAAFILKYRLLFIIATVVLTVFMFFEGRKAELTYDYVAIVPNDDKELVYFKRFKEIFGEDSNVLAIGMQDSAVYELPVFVQFKSLADSIAQMPGVTSVFALPRLQYLLRDTASRRMSFASLFAEKPASQTELDSLIRFAGTLKFYESQVVNPKNGATLLLITIDKKILNSPKRQLLTDRVMEITGRFEKNTKVKLHFAGIPFIRSIMATKVQAELKLFLVLSILVTAISLALFFRSWDAVVFPLLVIGVVVIWTLGTIGLFGYKITLLTGLLPSIIVVMSIPTCIYLLNKYHQEFVHYRDKNIALTQTISKLGLASFLINATTAVGFMVWITNNVDILTEFGIVSGLNVFVAFFISLFLIPAFFSYLPPPSPKKLKYLDSKNMTALLNWLENITRKNQKFIFGISIVATVVSLYGITKISSETKMLDDLPQGESVKADLLFFENNFKGVMPLEIVIDTGEKQGITKLKNLQRINQFEQLLSQNPALSRPVSMIQFVKAVRQAYYNNNPDFYDLPTSQDRPQVLLAMKKLSEDAKKSGDKTGTASRLVRSFVDSTGQRMRISLKVADLGSYRLDTLLRQTIYPAIDTAFGGTDLKAEVTGTTLLFTKGNRYLNEGLLSSLISSLVVIGVLTAFLFTSLRIIIICLIPNILALVITGGLMGYLGIPLKPATALIFSISFGIIVDVSTHYLARYRQELKYNKRTLSDAVAVTTRETGASIIYSSMILFFGFVIFVWSSFGGTQALGILMSVSMMIAMITNLTLLPALLLTFDTRRNQDTTTMLIDSENFYTELEDEEIDVSRLEVKEEKDEADA
jgi:uncharacterized protein